MSFTIAITGKGGVGKTTLAALIIRRLIDNKHSPVLAVDADPNTCLDEMLGVKSMKSIGSVREEARQIASKGLGAGISKQELLELKIAESLVEAEDFDLIAMGRPEGPGCYCYANNVLKETIAQISKSYPYVVLDNEAGLENLSRRIVQEVDLLVVATDPSKQGLNTVKRLFALALEMEIRFKKSAIVVNRFLGEPQRAAHRGLRKEVSADFLFEVPDDRAVALAAIEGESVFALPAHIEAVGAVDQILAAVNLS